MSLLAVKATSFDGNCGRTQAVRQQTSEASEAQPTNSAAVKSPTCPLNAVSFPLPSLFPLVLAPSSNRTTSTALAWPSRPATITLRSSPLNAKDSIPPRAGRRRREGAGASCDPELAEVEAVESALSEGVGRRTGVGGMSSFGQAIVNSLWRGFCQHFTARKVPPERKLTDL